MIDRVGATPIDAQARATYETQVLAGEREAVTATLELVARGFDVASVLRAGHRLRSPPNTSGSPADHSSAHLAARTTSAPASSGRQAEAWRLATHTVPADPGSTTRSQCIRRCSCFQASVSLL